MGDAGDAGDAGDGGAHDGHDGHDGRQQEGGGEDLSLFVQELLAQMQSKFEQMSDAVVARIDEMGTRIAQLEGSIGELMRQAEQLSLDGAGAAGAAAPAHIDAAAAATGSSSGAPPPPDNDSPAVL